ncbi:MAG: hypothetical protein R6X05_12010, partial [Desulfobacterales bacterium]
SPRPIEKLIPSTALTEPYRFDSRSTSIMRPIDFRSACVLTRYNWLQYQGAALPVAMAHCAPLPLDEIAARCGGQKAPGR